MTDYKTDPGLYPSDWKALDSIEDIQKIFEAYDFFNGRMIGGSKHFYRKEHPNDLIVFNANVITKTHSKVFYGDINLTEDFGTLREIAKCIGEPLYVLSEMAARFGNEDRPIEELITESIWNTTGVGVPDLEWYKIKFNGIFTFTNDEEILE